MKNIGNNIETIFEEYEKWLQNNVFTNLNESKDEIWSEFDGIIKDMEAELSYGVHLKENGLNTISATNIATNEKSFLYHPNVIVVYEDNDYAEAEFIENKCYYNGIENKLCDVLFKYYEEPKIYPKINYNRFWRSMFHELQHAYRYFNILKREEENKEKNVKVDVENDIYNNFFEDETIKEIVVELFYQLNQDEINSHLFEIYPFLKTHTEINRDNYKNYLSVIPSYNIIENLKYFQNIFNNTNAEKLPNIKIQLGKELQKTYGKVSYYNSLTPEKCFKLTRKRLNSTLLYTQKQFYRYLHDAFVKLNR